MKGGSCSRKVSSRLVAADRHIVIVELVGVGSWGGKLKALFEFGDFEGGLDGWISHNKRN